MPSRSGAEETLTSPNEQKANALVAAVDTKLMVATGSGDVQQLKDLVNKQGDSKMMVVVMAKQQAAASTEKPHQGNMNPRLLALASSGSSAELKSLLCREDSQVFGSGMDVAYDIPAEERQACGDGVEEVAAEGDSALVSASSSKKLQTIFNEEDIEASADSMEGILPMRRASDDIVEANESILEAITAEGHTASVCASSSEETQTLVNAEEGEVCANGADRSLHMRQASDDIVEANESILEGVVDEGDTRLVCASSSEKLQTLLNPEEGQACSNGTDGSLHMRRACDDIEANESILAGLTADGDTALHVVAASGQGDKFFTRYREAKHLLRVQQNNNRRRWLLPAQRHALTTYGDSDNFLESARIIYRKATHLLLEQNNNGDTPLHCAAQAGKSKMVACLIELALAEREGSRVMKELLRKENKHKETALHEAVRVGNNNIVSLLMDKDKELASFPQDGGASPMYLAIMLKQDEIVKTLYEKCSHGRLSFSGPNGQNALHAAVLRYRHQITGLTKLLKWNETHLCPQNKDLTTQRDENGSTPLHFAAAWEDLICLQVLEANPDALYQPDHVGLFPIHVAASVGASSNIEMFVNKYPGSAGLRDAKGRTFLHVAVEKRKLGVIKNACRNLSLSWIMNIVDNDGNTALHLAVEAGILRMICHLMGNPQVNLNLPNNRGETPLDIAQYKTHGFMYSQSSEAQIRRTLKFAGAVKGVRRKDHFQDKKALKVKRDKSKELEVLKDSTAAMCIGSVLITTVTFGATFAVPGGYIADDHSDGGSPILARRYAFDAFIASNTLAFVFSAMATIGLMQSGSPLFNPRSRRMHLAIAFILVSFSITCLTAAFALGAYVVLAPVAHKTAVATCVLTSLVLLFSRLEFIVTHLLLLPPLCTRKGPIWAWVLSPMAILGNMLIQNCPLILIFGWAVYANRSPKILAPAQAPAPAPAPLT